MIACSWDADALELFGPALDASPFGPLATPAEALGGSFLFEYADKGRHALVALRRSVYAAGSRLEVVGLASVGDRLQALPFYNAVEAIGRANGDRFVVCCTQRPHVVKSCVRAGFGISGAILLKTIDPS